VPPANVADTDVFEQVLGAGIMRRIRAKCPPPIRAVYTGIVRFREQASLAILAHNLLKAIQ